MGAQLNFFPFTIFRGLSEGLAGLFFVPVLYQTIASLGLIFALWERGDMLYDSKHLPTEPEVFDFIVVGAGSAGSVVANRLSQQYNVLLLEAGGEPLPLQLIPGFSVFLIGYPESDWLHKSVPQSTSCLNSVEQRSSWSAGRGLGGTGNINLMLHLRGSPKDFDNWAEITGDTSWNYLNVLPHFRRYENFKDKNADPAYRGFDGEVGVELPNYQGISSDFVAAGKELGYPEIDVNAQHTEGFFPLQHSTRNGIRSAPYKAFIFPARFRSSLTIRKYATVNKILFKDNSHEVYGVEYDRHGKTYWATAKKEVIISAGAITTPKLLMLSGIGPKEHLQEVGIPVRHDLPVGKNLQDHLSVYLTPFFTKTERRSILLDRDVSPEAYLKWFAGGFGPLSTSGATAAAVWASSYAKERGEGDWPDLVCYLFNFSVHKTFGDTFAKAFGLKLDDMRKYYEHAINKESFHFAISGARPYARGEIRLSSNSPYDPLVIDPRYFSGPDDLDFKVLYEGVQNMLYLVENTTTFNHIGAKFTNVPLPGCEHLHFRSEAYWECYIRRFTVTIHHPCGTAAMGPAGSPFAVTDSKLRVQGVRNLRVADASVMPVIPVTNTQAASLMIGEKAAHMILEQWQGGEGWGKSKKHVGK